MNFKRSLRRKTARKPAAKTIPGPDGKEKTPYEHYWDMMQVEHELQTKLIKFTPYAMDESGKQVLRMMTERLENLTSSIHQFMDKYGIDHIGFMNWLHESGKMNNKEFKQWQYMMGFANPIPD